MKTIQNIHKKINKLNMYPNYFSLDIFLLAFGIQI